MTIQMFRTWEILIWKILMMLFDYFFKINPVSNAWPYWREFVQSMSTRMGFPALTVPMLEIVPKKAAKRSRKVSSQRRIPHGERSSVPNPSFRLDKLI